jgi:hypothetical protein
LIGIGRPALQRVPEYGDLAGRGRASAANSPGQHARRQSDRQHSLREMLHKAVSCSVHIRPRIDPTSQQIFDQEDAEIAESCILCDLYALLFNLITL